MTLTRVVVDDPHGMLPVLWYTVTAVTTWLIYRIARRLARELFTVEEREG